MKVTFIQQVTKVKQLADTISLAISQGEYKAGDPLPSINWLSNRYEVSRDTVFKAFLDLRQRGLIESTPGKGYYVTGKLTNVLLLLDQFSPFKEELYASFIHKLPVNFKVDLLFHQYNERLFKTIIRESVGRYNKYVVMNFDNEIFSNILCKIDSSRLLLLDFGKFDKKDYSYVCQDFDESFYRALFSLRERFSKYQRLVMVFPKQLKHPQSSKLFFEQFCKEAGFRFDIIDSVEDNLPQRGDAYIAFDQQEVVSIIRQSRLSGLKCGKDFGLVAYNDIPSYEVIDEGITALTIDWKAMGTKAAEFILYNKSVHEFLSTDVHLRHSL